MSLQIYETKNLESTEYIKDVVSYFNVMCSLTVTEDVNMILSTIDKAKYKDANRVFDRFGTVIYKENISTGAKILLCVKQFPTLIFNADELGENAQLLLYEFVNGRVCFTIPPEEIFTFSGEDDIDIEYNGRRFCSAYEFNAYLEGLW